MATEDYLPKVTTGWDTNQKYTISTATVAPKKVIKALAPTGGTTRFNPQVNYKSTVFNINDLGWDDQHTPIWQMNTDKAIPVSLFGDLNGTIKHVNDNNNIRPIDENSMVSEILGKASSKRGGIIALKKQLVASGFIQSKYIPYIDINSDSLGSPTFQAALRMALRQGTDENQAKILGGAKKLNTFEDWLKTAKASGIYGPNGGGNYSRTTTITTQKFKPEEFDIPIDQMFQQTIGRGATNDELLQFTNMLNKYSAANPQKEVTVTSGNTATKTVSGGVDSNIMEAKMKEKAMANPDAENYNKATKYLDYFKQALAAPVQLG